MKILVVDNSSMIRMLIRYAIRVADWLDVEVVEAGDGLQGLAAVEQHGRTIDLILCDMNVPNMNGLSFLRSLRSSPELRQIPFVIMTAEGSGVSVERAIREGAAGVIDKPFRLDEMVDLVRRHRASLRDQRASLLPRGNRAQGEAARDGNPRRRPSLRKSPAVAVDRIRVAGDVGIWRPRWGGG